MTDVIFEVLVLHDGSDIDTMTTHVQTALDKIWPPDGIMSGCMCGKHNVPVRVLTGLDFYEVLRYMVYTHANTARQYNWILIQRGLSHLHYA